MTVQHGASVSGGAWSDGYVVDVSYIEPITTDLCPAWFSMACVLNGQPPIDTSRTIVWAELGSGSGLSACMVAAANANVEVWGCDFNPAHVERARSLATKAALTNCSFDEAAFEDVARDEQIGPAEVDVVVVHGVYSWISAANQRHIVEFIRRRLRPGGLAYVSYEVPTGWASMVPLSEAMRLHTEVDGRRSDLAFPEAVETIQRLADGGARFFPLGPHEARQLASLPDADVRYAVHEYVGSHFRPLMFDEVATEMASARCSYVGSIEPVDHLSGFWVPPELTDLVAGTGDPALRAMLRDLAVQRPLRRDLFRRGLATQTTVEQEERLSALTAVGLDKPLVDGASVAVPVGEVTLDVAYYGALIGALGEGSLSVADIRDLHVDLTLSDAVAALALLVSGGYAAPAPTTQGFDRTRASARRLNEVLIRENVSGGDHRWLVAPAIGSAVASEYIEMLTVGAVWDGIDADLDLLTDHALDSLDHQRRNVIEGGEVVTDPASARAVIEGRVDEALRRIRHTFSVSGIC